MARWLSRIKSLCYGNGSITCSGEDGYGRHLEGSREQAGAEDLKCVKFSKIQGKYLVLEEKVDGANCGVSFGRDGRMYHQSRGHFLNGGYGERQFDLFKL